MTSEQFKHEKRYQIAMHLARKMLDQNLISEYEYSEINTIFIEKYRPRLGSLYRDNP